MFSAANFSRPILLFVGRPLDPNKGLITFFDALEVLLSLKSPAKFSTWIIGGDPEELSHIHKIISVRPLLLQEFQHGHLLLWGKIKRDALPEFYRRSLVTVMPSFREQFGLVAIEAMACGTPVIGSRQGGIADTVLAGLTGATVEIDQPDALAGALLLYLRGPILRRTRGLLAKAWACAAFSKANVYNQMSHLYTMETLPSLTTLEWGLRRDFDSLEFKNKLCLIEKNIGMPVERWEIIAARHHVVIRLDTQNGPLALKIFRDRPGLSPAIFPIGVTPPARTAKDFIDNTLYHADNPMVPRLITADQELGIAVHAWVEAEPLDVSPANLHAIKQAFAQYGASKPCDPETDEKYSLALSEFLANRNEANLEQLDLASEVLNQKCQRAEMRIRATHPIAELTRIMLCLEKKGWPIPEDICTRMRMVIGLLLAKSIPISLKPNLCHGDLKSRHIFYGATGLQTFDTEHSVFAVGDLDVGTYAAAEVSHGANVFNVIRTIYEATESTGHATMAIQWMVYFLIHGYLARVHHGKITNPGRVIRRALSDITIAIT